MGKTDLVIRYDRLVRELEIIEKKRIKKLRQLLDTKIKMDKKEKKE
tara:strand:+ start:5400 stop:5537 length:138 start_codon:yes stop_codon:yes gene_type:complete